MAFIASLLGGGQEAPVAPERTDPAVAAKRERARLAALNKKGRRSTITGASGLLSGEDNELGSQL